MLWAVKFGKQINELIGNDNNLDWLSITTMGLNDNDDIQMKSISYKTRNIIFLSRKLTYTYFLRIMNVVYIRIFVIKIFTFSFKFLYLDHLNVTK